MKITHQTDTQLILDGIPGTLRWMLLAVAIGFAVAALTAFFAYSLWNEEGPGFYLAPMSVGMLMGLGMVWFGVAQLCARESLVLDKGTGRGEYTSNSPIVTTEKPFKFKLESIDSVAISTATIERPVSADEPGWSESKQVKASLRVLKPRRSVTLDETQNGRDRRVHTIATEVATFLAMDVKRG